MPTTDAREEIIQITQELFAMGLLTATGGNISARAADGETIWITPTRMFKGGLGVDDLVRIKADGTVVEGTRSPSIEYRMHWASYEARPDSTGVVHSHAPIITAFTICGQQFPPINTDAVLLADTPVVPWHLPGTEELATAVGKALHGCRGALLQNHGLITAGETLRQAATRAMMLEETAKLVLYCRQFGTAVTVIPADGIRRLAAFANFL